MEKSKIKSIIESLLFINSDPLAINKISKIIGLKDKEIEAILKEMKREWKEQQRGLTLVELDNKIQMTTTSSNASYVEKMIKKQKEEKLSPAARETLAIIAYRGPVTRMQIDLIRGVNSSFILRNLMIRGLVEKKENNKNLKKYFYQVTEEFLKGLGITSLEELPQYEKLRNNKKVDEILNVKKENNQDE